MRAELMFYSHGEILGDGLLKLPAIAAARAAFPEHRIIWCAASGFTLYASALKALAGPLIDEIVTPKPGGDGPLDWLTPRPFGGRRFDVVIDTQALLTPAVFAKRAARGLFVSPAARFALSDRKPAQPWPEHLTEQLCGLVSLAAGRPVSPVPVAIEDREILAAAAHLLPAGPAYVGFAPGAGGPDKMWPLERYLAVAAAVAAQGATPVFLIGPMEAHMAAPIREAMPHALLPEHDRTDPFAHVKGPLLAAALGGRLSAAVANDSGIGHALALGGAPLVSLQQSQRKARKFRPPAARLELVVAETFGEGVGAIPVEAVLKALDAIRSARS